MRSLFFQLSERLRARSALGCDDIVALSALPGKRVTLAAHTHLFREREVRPPVTLLCDGIAFSYKIARNGARQILALHIAGDLIGLESVILGTADCGAQTLTNCRVVQVDNLDCLKLIEARPRIARAICAESLVEKAMLKEQVLNVGRRSARDRLAHILCELGLRFERAGLASRHDFEIPFTQEQFADLLGITAVHVARVFAVLEQERVISRNIRQISVINMPRLRQIAGFKDDYLHCPATTPTATVPTASEVQDVDALVA